MHPVLGPVKRFLAALLLRVNDISLLRLDERWGEIILSKTLGLLLILAVLYGAGRTVANIGLHSRFLPRVLLITTLAVGPVYLVAYTLQFAVLAAAGGPPALELAALDPKTGMGAS